MAVINKYWGNGDGLLLDVSGNTISVSSDQNLTGADRQMTINLQTTGGAKTSSFTVKQFKQSILEDGFWVHKDTGVTTYFGADADFITNGIMSKPSWIANAKEIKLCTGITSFETVISDVHVTSSTLLIGDSDNMVLEKLDFGNANIENIPTGLLNALSYTQPTFFQGALHTIVFNSSVKNIDMEAFTSALVDHDVVIYAPVFTTVGGLVDIGGGEMIYTQGFSSVNGSYQMIFITNNVSELTTMLANAGGAGVSGVTGNYSVVSV